METTNKDYRRRVRWVSGPNGKPLTLNDLPPVDTKRWVIRRKAEVVAAVRGGLLSLEEACDRYRLTEDEFLHWTRTIRQFGIKGLRATKIQDYRQLASVFMPNSDTSKKTVNQSLVAQSVDGPALGHE